MPAALSVQPDVTGPGYATIAETMTPTAFARVLRPPDGPLSHWTIRPARRYPASRAATSSRIWSAKPGSTRV